MKILYVAPMLGAARIKGLLIDRGHEVIWVADVDRAFDAIRAQRFGAVLIAEQDEVSGAFDFISRIHREQPEVLVFPLSVWGSDLEGIFKLMEAFEESGAVP